MITSTPTPFVVGVAVLRPHVMRLLFDDGAVRDIRYTPGEARGSLIKPLDDADFFAKVRVDPEAGTVVWRPLGFRDVTAERQSA